jgi:deoxyribonuclease-4
MNLGAHMSIAGGAHRSLERGRALGCNAVQLFVKSPSQWRARPLAGEEIERFRALASLFAPNFIVGHASYLLNIASPDPSLLERSIAGLGEELRRAGALGVPYLVLHPGSGRGENGTRGARRAARAIDAALAAARGTEILLETTAGQGHTLGRSFEELARIIELCRHGDRIGVCFDTCHAFAAGYDLRTRRAFDRTFDRFDRTIGLDRLKVFHLNDSARELGSGVDRHAHIGRGTIGERAFALLVNDGRFLDRPMILETPKDARGRNDRRNLALLRGLRRQM